LLLRELIFGAQACDGDSCRHLESIIAKIEVPDVRFYLRSALLPTQFWEIPEPVNKERRQSSLQKVATLVHESFDAAQSSVYGEDDNLREEVETVQGGASRNSGQDSNYQKPLPACIADNHTMIDETRRHFCYYKDMMEYAQAQDWDTCEVEDEPLLECLTRVVLTALLKHTGLLSGCNTKYVYVLNFLQHYVLLYYYM
jgi:hypothetical protein